jgi:hypothetical protein
MVTTVLHVKMINVEPLGAARVLIRLRELGSTSESLHGVGDLFTALRRQGLIPDELVLQLATFLRSLDLFLELIVLTQ